jgi:hypothetical protein
MKRHLTFANVMVVLLTFIVLGGGAYAASKLPNNSVGAKQLKKNAVTAAKIKAGAVSGAKVKDSSLTAADIGGPVDSAKNASHAANADRSTSADRATDADKLDGIDSTGFQPARVKIEKPEALKGGITDFTPNVAGISTLVLDYDVPTVLGSLTEPNLPGGVSGQRLTIVSIGEAAIFTTWQDLKLANSGAWSGEKGDTLSLVFANGVWYEIGRSKNH